jgi:hypothetical protein
LADRLRGVKHVSPGRLSFDAESAMKGLTRYLLLLSLLAGFCVTPGTRTSAQAMPVRVVNAPHFGPAGVVKFVEGAIFWFGRVTPNESYADVRVGYNDSHLWVYVAVFDQWLWYDETPAAADLTQWDAVTLFLKTGGNTGAAPGTDAYRFVAQLSGDADPRYRLAWRGNESGWQTAPIAFEAQPGWRGDRLNDNNDTGDRGWAMAFNIPFASLGLSGPPHGQRWGIAMRVHDRDSAAGPALPDKIWPEAMASDQPSTWAQLHFGLPTYAPPPLVVRGLATVYHKYKGANVPDGAVGGYTVCGDGMDFWTEWGQRVYYTFPNSTDEYGDFNIQNQADIADWPCFSKYYVTFPLPALPPGSTVVSATLTLHLFGGAGDPNQRPDSLIQVLTVNEDWNEATLNWNNAPLPLENVSRAWVKPVKGNVNFPGIPYRWDVSYAVAKAYAAGRPLRLAMYSADSDYHTGKYFISSDTGDWNEAGRPRLDIAYGEAFSVTSRTFVPIARR